MNLESLYPQPFHFSSFSRSRGIMQSICLAAPNFTEFAAFSRLSYAIASIDLLLLMTDSHVSHCFAVETESILFFRSLDQKKRCDDSSPVCVCVCAVVGLPFALVALLRLFALSPSDAIPLNSEQKKHEVTERQKKNKLYLVKMNTQIRCILNFITRFAPHNTTNSFIVPFISCQRTAVKKQMSFVIATPLHKITAYATVFILLLSRDFPETKTKTPNTKLNQVKWTRLGIQRFIKLNGVACRMRMCYVHVSYLQHTVTQQSTFSLFYHHSRFCLHKNSYVYYLNGATREHRLYATTVFGIIRFAYFSIYLFRLFKHIVVCRCGK